MSLPPDLSKVSTEQLVQMYKSRFAYSQQEAQRYPVGRELDAFFPLVHKALISKQKTENIKEDKMVLFVEDDPPEKLDSETITFHLQSRSPGQFAQGPAGAGSHKEVRHHIRNIESHPDHPNEKLITLGKWYDNHIRFNVYARTNKQARQRLMWFTSVMDSYNWYFALNSFRVVEKGVGDRERVEIGGLTVTKYPVSYYVRSEDVRHIGTQEMKQVTFTVDVESE
jgi:hypothetical protein